MDQKTNTGWIIAAILAVVLIIMVLVLLNKPKDLDTVLSDGYKDLAMIRAELQIRCEGPDANEADCAEAREELQSILEEFSDDINAATSSMPTTTPE